MSPGGRPVHVDRAEGPDGLPVDGAEVSVIGCLISFQQEGGGSGQRPPNLPKSALSPAPWAWECVTMCGAP